MLLTAKLFIVLFVTHTKSSLIGWEERSQFLLTQTPQGKHKPWRHSHNDKRRHNRRHTKNKGSLWNSLLFRLIYSRSQVVSILWNARAQFHVLVQSQRNGSTFWDIRLFAFLQRLTGGAWRQCHISPINMKLQPETFPQTDLFSSLSLHLTFLRRQLVALYFGSYSSALCAKRLQSFAHWAANET